MGWVVVPLAAISIPIITIILKHIQVTKTLRLKEMEMQKEMMELEIAKQNGRIKLLEEENKNLDKKINE